jgi:hypothetical protein
VDFPVVAVVKFLSFAILFLAALGLIFWAHHFLSAKPQASYDPRTPIRVSQAQRQAVLAVMRDNINWLHDIFAKLETADAHGRVAAQGELRCPAPLGHVLGDQRPGEWRALGRALHEECHRLVEEWQRRISVQQVSAHLKVITSSCIACHQRYRLDPSY